MSNLIRSFQWLIAFAACLVLCGSAEAARGRPVINATRTTFVADNGQLLRGAIISTERGAVPSLASFLAIKNHGLNAVHCYAERNDYGYAAGAKAAALDAVVKITRDNGLYLIITVGSGGINETFNSAFWRFYAPRYKNESHVIYEIQNEPAYGPPYSSAAITMEKNNYNIIRAAAPDTPVLLMSYMFFQNAAGVLKDMATLGSTINWNNAAIGFHGYGEKGSRATLACLKTVLAAGYPCFQTEFYRWPWGLGDFGLGQPASLYEDTDQMGDLERLGVSWLSFLHIQRVPEDFRFKDRIKNAGILWAPDFGTWPSGSRSIFGNSGEPRAIIMSAATRIQAEDFDHGGQGVAYNDTTASGNAGGQYRADEAVDIQATTDTGGGYNIGWVTLGEWTEYTVYVHDPGIYKLNVRVASPQSSNSFSVMLGGVDLTGAWSFSGTGGNQNWMTLSKSVSLTPGQQVLRLSPLSSGMNLNWIELVPDTSGVIANGVYRIVNRNSGKVMDVAGASTANGAKILQWDDGSAANQQWVFTHKGANQYTITSVQTGKAVDEESNNNLSGNFIAVWPVKTTPGQRWLVTLTGSGYYKLISVNSGLALEVTSASKTSGAIVQQAEFHGGNHQQWRIAPAQPATFATWVNQHFPLASDRANPAISEATADPTGQGVANLARYAFSLSARESPSSVLPVATSVSSGLAFRFRFDPGLTDLTYRVEASTNLIHWTETLFDSRRDAHPAITDGWIQINDIFDPQQTPRRFLRLRILKN